MNDMAWLSRANMTLPDGGSKSRLGVHGMAEIDQQLLIFGCVTWDKDGTGMNRQRELFEGTLGQYLT